MSQASRKLQEIVQRRVAQASMRVGAEVGQAQVVNIRRRVAQGLGLTDQKMPRYSDAYRRRKAKSGRNADIRDLTWTGRMLGALVVEIMPPSGPRARVRIRFADTQSHQRARWNQQLSPWFGVSPRDLATLRGVMRRALSAALKQRS